MTQTQTQTQTYHTERSFILTTQQDTNEIERMKYSEYLDNLKQKEKLEKAKRIKREYEEKKLKESIKIESTKFLQVSSSSS